MYSISVEASTSEITYLENITNSRKDRVGKAQLCITDHVSPSTGMGGKDSKLYFKPYILLRASENANLQFTMWRNQVKRLTSPTHIERKIYDDIYILQHHPTDYNNILTIKSI